mmetsp:Transcript_16300/g.31313  ORF Transcript_16300/g.31313 Transcript_16300/m.31313 type:complete len:252 (+) Transcript_16300:930-1685(+)
MQACLLTFEKFVATNPQEDGPLFEDLCGLVGDRTKPAPEDDDEEAPDPNAVADLGTTLCEADAARLAGAEGAAVEAYCKACEHVRSGCTFKTCCALAAYTIRADAGLEPALQADGSEAKLVDGFTADLQKDIDAAIAEQALVCENTQDAAPARSPGRVRVTHSVGLGLSLAHPFELESGCGFPEWTNYVQGFTGCLDYIWCDKRSIKVLGTLPEPPLASITKEVALPSSEFPSDHLPMACEIQLRYEGCDW